MYLWSKIPVKHMSDWLGRLTYCALSCGGGVSESSEYVVRLA